ncbi:hypothetical protein [Streptomyces katsurahamanus]|uniref:hypothetical protein n=1 Tax=Streptomyces katsurahamanus TaxID=2577098 RepID=UPI002B1F82BD|nr:hypothetical protein [Streptomyces katsurahamanus]
MTVVNKAGHKKEYDFARIPVSGPMRQSLASLFAVQSRNWNTHASARKYWTAIESFERFLSQMENPPEDLDGLTVAMIRSWRDRHIHRRGGVDSLMAMRTLLQRDSRLADGPVAEELARRIPQVKSSRQSYGESERKRVVLAARQQFRSAWIRITENTRLLEEWRSGGLAEGSREWRIGQVLDHLATTGDVPGTTLSNGQVQPRNRVLLGSRGPEKTWGRLFLTRRELTALAVVLTDKFAWNMSVYDRLDTPTKAPSAGETASVTYQVQIEKRRKGSGQWFSTENITDSGADSDGRLITQALEATAHGRALAAEVAAGKDLLMVARTCRRPFREPRNMDRPRPAGLLIFGVSQDDARHWANSHELDGSPFQRTRRTTVTNEGRPLQHSRGTHESIYVLPDQRVQHASREVFEAGAREALEQARAIVFDGNLADRANADHQETVTADCEDEATSPWPAPGGGCGADFLLCLACPNAHVHPGHHPRLNHLHQQLGSLKSALDSDTFQERWGDHLLRLEDLRVRVGPAAWEAASGRADDTDRTIVQLLLKEELAP